MLLFLFSRYSSSFSLFLFPDTQQSVQRTSNGVLLTRLNAAVDSLFLSPIKNKIISDTRTLAPRTEFYPVYDILTLSMTVKEAESVPCL